MASTTTNYDQEDLVTGAKEGAGRGALAGASTGASIGTSIVPGLGTAVGGVIGALLGAGIGAGAGVYQEKKSQDYDATQKALKKMATDEASDKQAAIRSYQEAYGQMPSGSFAPDESDLMRSVSAPSAPQFDAWHQSIYGA